jgi:hypothetical protein
MYKPPLVKIANEVFSYVQPPLVKIANEVYVICASVLW